MNPMSRNVLAAVVTAAVALGVTAPVAVAAPKDRSGGVVKTAKPDKAAEKADKLADKLAEQAEKLAEKAAKAADKSGDGTSGKTSVAGKDAPKVKSKATARDKKVAKLTGKKADRRLAQLQRRLTKEAVKKERYLERLVASKKVTRLPEAQQTSVISSNISADLSELADLKAAIAAGEDLRGVAKDLRTLRPEVYNVILNQLRLAEKLRTELGAADEPVVEEPAVDVPVDEPAVEEPVASVTAEDGSTEEPADTAEEPAEDVADEPSEDAAEETPVVDEVSLDAVVAKLLTFNARTTRVELRATQRALSQIKEGLEADEDAEDAADEDAEDEDAEDAEDAEEVEDDVDDDTPVAGTPVVSS